jgi:hypothetical protein
MVHCGIDVHRHASQSKLSNVAIDAGIASLLML